MAKKLIPDDVKKDVADIVEQYNQKELSNLPCYFVARFRGNFLYLDRYDYDRKNSICRLKYTGNFKDWEFAIFKWSSETYDANDWFFPGGELFDGTVEGAMKAGMKAYPL